VPLGSAESGRELLHDPAAEHVGHVEDVADVDVVLADRGLVVPLELVNREREDLYNFAAMPIIETARGPVAISAETCEALLDEIRHLEMAPALLAAFTRGGLGNVELDTDGKRLVFEAISRMEPREFDADPQLTKLRDYLIAEFTGAA
jgi:hypothetical protein